MVMELEAVTESVRVSVMPETVGVKFEAPICVVTPDSEATAPEKVIDLIPLPSSEAMIETLIADPVLVYALVNTAVFNTGAVVSCHTAYKVTSDAP
jgi:hypothetical protein